MPRFSSFARFIAWLLIVQLLVACASTPEAEPDKNTTAEVEQAASGQVTAVEDPFENINRAIFAFNTKVDNWVLKPAAKGYKAVMPGFVKIGISNFFSNLKEVTNTVNNVLQWEWVQAGNNSGRFLINSTIGLVGFFDVASKMGLEQSEGEDFGQTLAVWGVDAGPYLMLPILGPATVRSGAGMLVDQQTDPVSYVNPTLDEYGLRAVRVIDLRAGLLETESLITGDSYTLLRSFYLQRRHYLIKDGAIEDDFGTGYGDYGSEYHYDE